MLWERTNRIDNMPGREPGRELGREFNSFEDAKDMFQRRYKVKTGNKWADYPRLVHSALFIYNFFSFNYHPGKFIIVNRDLQIEEEIDGNSTEELEPEVDELIKMICDKKMLEQAANDIEMDTKKIPLGILTEEQIVAGEHVLREIKYIIERNSGQSELQVLCNEYYSKIPRAFGRGNYAHLINDLGRGL